MKTDEYAVYGSEGRKRQKLFERVIYRDKAGIGYVKNDVLISFMSKDQLLNDLNTGPYRYIDDSHNLD